MQGTSRTSLRIDYSISPCYRPVTHKLPIQQYRLPSGSQFASPGGNSEVDFASPAFEFIHV